MEETIKQIKKVLDLGMPPEVQFDKILRIIGKHPNSINSILQMLQNEREENNELITDLNLEVGRLDIMVSDPSIGGDTDEERKKFRNENIRELYSKWSHRVNHCFRKKF